ncbi:MAG: YbaB/EbfC family nucleoid-associated protein [Lactobacillus sp.]|jgi:DNA-binding YbaB/EbfC family protein|nr:YbaB/EbfC family nucleoid-associated protein [Lactobacillus sp.]
MDIQMIMRQAQAMQKKMAEAQEQLEKEEVEGSSGGGMVKVVLNGRFDMKKISLDKSLVDPEDTEILEDLIMAAFNDAKAKVDAKTSSAMGNVTGGMKMPFGM